MVDEQKDGKVEHPFGYDPKKYKDYETTDLRILLAHAEAIISGYKKQLDTANNDRNELMSKLYGLQLTATQKGTPVIPQRAPAPAPHAPGVSA